MSFAVENYTTKLTNHNGKDIIAIYFPNDLKLRMELKERLKVYWSQTLKAWYCLDMSQYRDVFQIPRKSVGMPQESRLSDLNQLAFQNMRQLLVLQGKSIHTQTVYLNEFFQFLFLLKNHHVDTMTNAQLKSYLYYCINTLKLTENTIHSRMNALKFYYCQVLKRPDFFLEIPRPKKPSTLPKAISKMDIKKMFDVIENPKHKLALMLVYGMGLRVSEIVNLKITDIDSNRMVVHIRCAKGKKDRYTPLPQTVLDDLRSYYKLYQPKDFLFEGQTGGQYTIRSVQAVFHQAMQKAKINKKVGIHGLRHSYATHLLEGGIDISFIQKLLGHNDIKTTAIYAKVSQKSIENIVSPLDTM